MRAWTIRPDHRQPDPQNPYKWVLSPPRVHRTFGSSNINHPEAMKSKHADSLAGSILAGLLSLGGIVCFAMAAQASNDEVTICGRLHAENNALSDAVVVVELGNDACLRSELDASGRFKFNVPVGTKARLIFIKPGYLTKEVEVDTKNALTSDRARQLNKKVKFDVVLEEELQHVNEVYMGPVGYIHFVNGSGLMRVRHDERMIPLQKTAEAEPLARN